MRLMVWRAAVRIAYRGEDFIGSQRQPHERTVEDEVIRCLRRIKAIGSLNEARFSVASRTDRGVSALCNVVAFDTSFRREKLLGALNSQADGVFFTALAEVPSSWSPRRADERWYRYFLPIGNIDTRKAIEAAKAFEGQHDFRRFCKVDARGTKKRLSGVEAFPLGEFLVIDLRGREFLRNMVRRIVAAVDAVGRGKATVEDIERALNGESASFGLAPAENLVLMLVSYSNIEFESSCPGSLCRRAEEMRRRSFVEMAFADGLLAGCERTS